MTDEFICKYCGKVCKNDNSLRQHEIRCKMNPSRIVPVMPQANPEFVPGFKKGTKIWVHKNDKSNLISIDKLSDYISDGWTLGISVSYKQKISKSLIGGSFGRCKDPIKEQERKQKISNRLKGNTNWKFNKHHGNAKQGRYNGIECDSTWELAYLVYHVEHNLYIERCKEKRTYIYKGEQHTYIPDFVTNESIVEIKGRITEQSIQKQIQNPDIKVIHTEEMKPYLDYVVTKYGDEFWKVLYNK